MAHTGDRDFAFIVDRSYANTHFHGIEVITPQEFLRRREEGMQVFVFAVSNGSLNSILVFLATHNFKLGRNVFLYHEMFRPSFERMLEAQLGWKADRQLLRFATAYTLNSRKPVHTTICGTWLFLEALHRIHSIPGDVAEVGAFEGGNVLLALQSPVWPKDKKYYMFDSFEGFPELSAADPANFGRGDYHPEHSLEELLIPFNVYPEVRIIKGFVPSTFAQVSDRQYSLVFFDCDLYQAALDTFEHLWDRIASGGMMLVHDYFAQPDGFGGVKAATDSFFATKNCRQVNFWQNTMAMLIKP
jgi:O-methyltransferase